MFGSRIAYRPGPGVLARSSEKFPFFERPIIEKAADACLSGIVLPSSDGKEYEFADGVVSRFRYRVLAAIEYAGACLSPWGWTFSGE